MIKNQKKDAPKRAPWKSQNTLTRAGIREAFQRHLHVDATVANLLLESIIENIKKGIIEEDYIKIFSFGTFLIHKKRARIGRNPKTKEEVTITPRRSVSFRASDKLLDIVNKR